MRNYFIAFLFAASLSACSNQPEQTTNSTPAAKTDSGDKVIEVTKVDEVDTSKKSIKATVTQNINGKHVSVYYHSPAVRGREIWGGLVPFDTPWVTGAHMATTLETDAPIEINNVKLPAGKYGLFTIPTEKEWTFIVNKNWQQHLTDEYDPKDDLVRVKVKTDSLDYHQERLMYKVRQNGENKGYLEFRWEKLRFIVDFRVGN